MMHDKKYQIIFIKFFKMLDIFSWKVIEHNDTSPLKE